MPGRDTIYRDSMRRSGGDQNTGPSGPSGPAGPPSIISVANIAALALVNDVPLVEGQPAFVGNTSATIPSVHATWHLEAQTGLTVDGITVINAASGVRQWVRDLSVGNPYWSQRVFWSVDPANASGVASDENAGFGVSQVASDLVPLLSLEELNRRMSNFRPTVTPFIHLLSSAPRPVVLENMYSQQVSLIFPKLVGKPVSTTVAAIISGYATKVPPTNSPYQMNLTAAATHVGEIIITTNLKWAFVLAALSANVAQLSCPIHTGDPYLGNTGEPGDFVNGETFQCYTLPKLLCWPFGTGSGVKLCSLVEIDNSGSNLTVNNAGGGYPYLSACINRGAGLTSNNSRLNWTGSLVYSGCLIVAQGAGTGIAITNADIRLHACAILNAAINAKSSNVRLQEEYVSQNGIISCDSASVLNDVPGATPALHIGIFGVGAASAPLGGTRGGEVRFKSTGTQTIYGSGNTPHLVDVKNGRSYALPKAGLTWITSAAKPLLVSGVEYDFADIPLATALLSGVSDGDG